MEESILNSTKKILGLDAANDAFDLDIMTFINTALFRLKTLGLAPANGAMVVDDSTEWADIFEDFGDLQAIKTYVFLRVKLLFDPPATPAHINAFKEQQTELEQVLLTESKLRTWVGPSLAQLLP